MGKSIFHDMSNQLLISKGMTEIAVSMINKIPDLPNKDEIIKKLNRSIEAMNATNELIKAGKEEYIYKLDPSKRPTST